jgi:hypothetical protein
VFDSVGTGFGGISGSEVFSIDAGSAWRVTLVCTGGVAGHISVTAAAPAAPPVFPTPAPSAPHLAYDCPPAPSPSGEPSAEGTTSHDSGPFQLLIAADKGVGYDVYITAYP